MCLGLLVLGFVFFGSLLWCARLAVAFLLPYLGLVCVGSLVVFCWFGVAW